MIKPIAILLTGIFFGIVMIKSQIISWFRIQEMVFFDDIHMYGVIGMAILTGSISLQIIKRFNIKTIDRVEPHVEFKSYSNKNLIGGIIFGLGWSISGACPGPIYALIGSGATPYILVILGALLGSLVHRLLPN